MNVLSVKKHWPLVALLLFSLLASQMIPAAAAQTNTTNIRVQLNGPSVLGVLKSGDYSATVNDPEGRTWHYKVWVTGSNLTGASPPEASPFNGTLDAGNTTFLFNITAMQKPGELDIHVNCTSGTLYYEKVQPIMVVTPIVFNVNINNPSNVNVKNATVKFLVDGAEIDHQLIDSIPARQSVTATTDWIAADKAPGWHDSTIIVDLNGDGIIDKDAGDMRIEDRFYIKGGGNMVFGLTVLAGVLALMIGLVLLSRRKIR